MGSQALPECVELNAYRLERDWTWDQLAEAFKRAGVPMSARTLHYLLKRAPEDATPRDRTLHKIRLFLKHTRELSRRRAHRRKAGPAADVISTTV